MKRSPRGWRFDDLDRLYRGFGFDVEEGGKHRLYIHPAHPQLRATVARHRSLAIGYIAHAIEIIDRLIALEEGTEDGDTRRT
jgi:hypothetical protein